MARAAALALALQAGATLAQAPADAGVYDRRAADWRNGAIVYQVLVDRFAPAADLAAKRHLYPPPKVLRHWEGLAAFEAAKRAADELGGTLRRVTADAAPAPAGETGGSGDVTRAAE